MGGNLPVLKPKEIISILQNLGFVMTRQRGSHQQFRHKDGRATTVPVHGSRDISPIFSEKQVVLFYTQNVYQNYNT
jgi:predicted RNA binding protein YcfA (HicA-like mRNA interferase family)